MTEFRREQHRRVLRLLQALDGDFLATQNCYFGGGTRVSLALGEYRESRDVDFLCADIGGYRALRAGIAERSLGPILRNKVAGVRLLRDVRADQYGIRTVIDVDGAPLKFEIILEARIALQGERTPALPVAVLDQESCFAEKWLANADRWNDTAVLSRDLVDLAFMLTHWPEAAALAGATRAAAAYGVAVRRAAVAATARYAEDAALRRRVIEGLGIDDTRSLAQGVRCLQKLASRLPASN